MKKIRNYAVFVTVLTMLCTQFSCVSALEKNYFQGIEKISLLSSAVGETITQDDIVYKVTRVASAKANGTVSVVDGKAAVGNVVIPASLEIDGYTYDVKAIEANAFKGNTELTGIDLSQTSINDIKSAAFADCTALINVQVPSTNTVYLNLGNQAFARCTALKKINFQIVQIQNRMLPFTGSGIEEITMIDTKNLKANAFSGLPDGLKITIFNKVSKTYLDATMLGTTKNVTIYVSDQASKEAIENVLGTKATVALISDQNETYVNVKDNQGNINGYATLEDAFNAINSSEEEGPYTVTLKSQIDNIVWPEGLVPEKETVIDFAQNSVVLPETLTLKAPLTIQRVNNFKNEALCSLDAGEYAFVMKDGGSFGFKTIIGNDLTFSGRLPGSQPLGTPCQIVGNGAGATLEFINIGSSNYYYNFPTISHFDEVILNKAFFTATQEQIADTDTINIQKGGLEVLGKVNLSRLVGQGEIRFKDASSLNVKETIEGSWVLPAIDQEIDDIPLTLPINYQASVKDKNNLEITAKVNEAIVEVTSGSLQGQQYSTLKSALKAVENEEGEVSILLLGNTTLEQSDLPKVDLIIDGDGHQLSTAIDTIKVYKNLVLRNINLDFEKTILNYAAQDNKDRIIKIEESVTGKLNQILDNSQSRWLDIELNGSGLEINKVIGTTSTIQTKLTDLLINNYGTKDNPVDLSEKVENLAATAINNSYLKIAGDSTYLGTIRTPSADAQGGLVLTDDAEIKALSLWKNTAFELTIPSSKTLTIGKVSIGENISVTLQGEPKDGQPIIHLNSIPNKGAENYFVLKDAPENTVLVWDKDTGNYVIHVHSFELKSDENGHWQECVCGEKTEVLPHHGGTATCHTLAVCEECSHEYGELDSQNHSGSTELRDSVEATIENEGYTGDLYCLGCNTIIEKGHIIDKLVSPTDTKELEQLILDVKTILLDEEKYTEETVDALKAQLTLAENLLTQNPTQDEIDTMKTALEKALGELVEKEEPTKPVEPTDPVEPTKPVEPTDPIQPNQPTPGIDVEPTKPDDKEDEEVKEQNTVETSDQSFIAFYVGAVMLSATAMVIARKKKEE